MKYLFLLSVVTLSLTFTSCVSTKKFNALDVSYKESEQKRTECSANVESDETQIKQLSADKTSLQAEVDNLNQRVDSANARYNEALKAMANLSVVSGTEAENLKESLEAIQKKDAYINSIHAAISSRDSFTAELVMDFKNILNRMADTTVKIRVDRGETAIDILDQSLFGVGDNEVSDGGKVLLGKLATVFSQYPDMKFMVECRAGVDSLSDSTGYVANPWGLSSKRAASVINVLASTYNISPARMTLIGKSETVDTSTSDTPDTSAISKTTIVIPARPDPLLDLQVSK